MTRTDVARSPQRSPFNKKTPNKSNILQKFSQIQNINEEKMTDLQMDQRQSYLEYKFHKKMQAMMLGDHEGMQRFCK